MIRKTALAAQPIENRIFLIRSQKVLFEMTPPQGPRRRIGFHVGPVSEPKMLRAGQA